MELLSVTYVSFWSTNRNSPSMDPHSNESVFWSLLNEGFSHSLFVLCTHSDFFLLTCEFATARYSQVWEEKSNSELQSEFGYISQFWLWPIRIISLFLVFVSCKHTIASKRSLHQNAMLPSNCVYNSQQQSINYQFWEKGQNWDI